jgi:uncharacterized membrane protein SpoIIM required for sporulation
VAELRLKSFRFRAEREADWRRLEALLNKAEGRPASALTDEELVAMPVLYRSALSSLSVARATSLDQALVDYLESLAARAYFFVYGVRTSAWRRARGFFAHDWPAAAKAAWRETLVSFGLTLAGAIVAYVLTLHDSSWFSAFVPGGLAEGRGPDASTESLRSTLFDNQHREFLSAFAAFLFTHNSGVAIFAFALGFAFGAPTALLMIYNGCALGTFFAVFMQHGLGVDFGGWIFIHGVTELFATILAGAAGFKIGWAVAFPGERTRLDSASRAGREAAVLMAGVVVMLFCAGILEGVGRQLILITWIRYAIAASTGLFWLTYLYAPRRKAGATARG